MKVIHTVWICIACGKYNEVSEEEIQEDGQVQCSDCGYAIDLNDERFITEDKEY
jgi:DNA-directed RNA polymerase subunit RPC12/RpoP